MPLPQLISISPNPIPSAPCWVLVCFDFSGGASSPVILELDFHGTPFEYRVEVSKDEPCVKVYIPAGCIGLTVTDTSVQSQDCTAPVLP